MNEPQAKARINIQEGTVELEGSESFVVKYLDEFKRAITNETSDNPPKPKPTLAQSVTKNPASQARKVKSTKPGKVKSIKAEAFEIKAKGKNLGLKEFFESKGSPASANKRIAVIGYYITKILNAPFFTEGNIEFAYKILKLDKRPMHMRQACTDAKNQQQYLETVERSDDEMSAWSISRVGEIFVEDELSSSTK